ncbi:Adaptive-response sensory-kinase SasA [Pararobbsia alpina]|uniref:histidine kinase n=1 Tax=Pararobbsia alpina TaxID=621374 RepID=A0A6S7C5G3_9BURK|nr:Adaptive-response sensory-kinase SasA [Pararobbsia alpina]
MRMHRTLSPAEFRAWRGGKRSRQILAETAPRNPRLSADARPRSTGPSVAAVFHDRYRRANHNAPTALAPSAKATKSVIEFDTLAEAVPQIVWITGADGLNIYFNQQWEEYTGLTVEQGHGHGWNIPFHPDDRQRAWEAWKHAWQTDGVYSLECRLRRKDGAYRWWLIRGKALHDEKGKIVNWYGTWTDVEDIKQTEEELKRAYDEIRNLYEKTKALNQFKTQMFANVSHELRTPLTLILAPIENLLSMGLPQEVMERLGLAQRNARGLLKQINNLLDVARLEAGKATVTYYEADLAKLIKHIASSFENMAKEKDIRFSVITPLSMPAQIDVEKLERILVNLLSNAFKFTPAGGAIRCQLHENSEPLAVIDLGDSGPGVSEPFRDSIFEKFYQIPGSARFGGTGLGLSIVKDFVEIQHGRVTVGQSSEGGALFTIEIPVKAPEGTPVICRPDVELTAPQFVDESLRPFRREKGERAKPREPVDVLDESKRRKSLVLVVEDNPDMREYICETLGPDVEFETAENGREGLEKALTIMPDLIISDIMMPEMDGDEMFRRIRANRELKTIPFILVTAKADEELRIELLREGAIDYLIKPFMPEELRSKARNFLAVKASEAKYRELMESAQVDVGVVVKASQAVSGEIEFCELIEMLLKIVIEHAGAERGLLILFRGDEPRIEAEATNAEGRVNFTLRQAAVTPSELPEFVLRYVIRTHESVILDDAAAPTLFSADTYVQHQRPRSVLCLPLVKQAKLVGALYVENNSTPGAFTSGRIAVLEVVASLAAISLENALLYADLQRENSERKRAEQALREREARIRRLGDSNILGLLFWDVAGNVTDANDAFLQIVGYSRQDLLSGHVRWTDMTPPEYRAADARAIEELMRTGTCQSFEKEYIRKDGRHVPVLIGGALLEGSQENGVAFVLDLTERKEAEAELAARRTEAKRADEQLLALQAELAHATRVTTLGELSASIAHEVGQPLSAIVTNGEACLRWLGHKTPQPEEVRACVELMIAEGWRASEIVLRVRSLTKRDAPQKMPLELNDVVNEVVALVQSEVLNHRVALRLELVSDLPALFGDRVQLQQVLINLVMNGIQAMADIGDGPRELLIESHRDDAGYVVVAVQDSGTGINPENADRLFEPFFTTKSNGMGMGLSICRSIIEAHGGQLWASNNTGPGATFQFSLPSIGESA